MARGGDALDELTAVFATLLELTEPTDVVGAVRAEQKAIVGSVVEVRRSTELGSR